MIYRFRILFFVAVMLFPIRYLSAEVVNLSGTVQNRSNDPVAGAEVKLLSNSNISTTTDSDGKFVMSGQITSVMKPIVSGVISGASIRGFNVQVMLRQSSSVAISVYNVAGKKIYDFNSGMLNAGLNAIALPINRFGAGVYMISVNCEDNRYVFKYLFSSQNSFVCENFNRASGLKAGLQQSAFLNALPAVDTLLVSAEGYKSIRCPVESYDQSDITIILESTVISRLDNITKDCADGEKPGPIMGGQNGWGSRYWDCCKPHCSWPDKTSHYAANCGIDGKTQVACFKEVGDEHWTGLEGTKSGCEQGGEAFMCYCHVPFAVCKNLAYGFAAVPSGDDVCGKCFQLDFDGGFKHGEPKPAHALMKGKTMIVMASNIGHDVGGGQFDIMIPGGGLGAFRNGCATQWKVDVNNESLVGKGSGGFTSSCQEKLGWDAEPEAIKLCVRSMCDNLFGKDPALKDLWEGCIWYVEWMHAVDNPTFSYKEVACPKALLDLYYSTYHPMP